MPGIVPRRRGQPPAARTDTAARAGTCVLDPAIIADDTGSLADDTGHDGPGGTSPIPANSFVGTVSDTGPQFAVHHAGPVIDGSFQLVDQAGNPVTPTGPVSEHHAQRRGCARYLAAGQTADPLYDATDRRPRAAATPAAC